jgi:hypothetical protein
MGMTGSEQGEFTMILRLLTVSIIVTLLLAAAQPVHTLVFFRSIKPGEVVLGHGWLEEQRLRDLLQAHTSIGGQMMDGDGGCSATYRYQGREVAVQRMINDLNRLKMEGTSVVLVEDEGYRVSPRKFNNPEIIGYDWTLTISSNFLEEANGKLVQGMNSHRIHMTVYLGARLDRSKLRVPEWMQPALAPTSYAHDGPVSAFQAIARGMRND